MALANAHRGNVEPHNESMLLGGRGKLQRSRSSRQRHYWKFTLQIRVNEIKKKFHRFAESGFWSKFGFCVRTLGGIMRGGRLPPSPFPLPFSIRSPFVRGTSIGRSQLLRGWTDIGIVQSVQSTNFWLPYLTQYQHRECQVNFCLNYTQLSYGLNRSPSIIRTFVFIEIFTISTRIRSHAPCSFFPKYVGGGSWIFFFLSFPSILFSNFTKTLINLYQC